MLPPISTSDKIEIDNQLCVAMVTSNLPWHMVENPEFQQYCKMLRPNYQVPTRKTLSTTALDRVLAKVECHNEEFRTQSRMLTLMSDGKTNVIRRNLSNYVLVEPNGESILDDLNTETPAKTGSKIMIELLSVGSRLKSDSECEFNVFFVSDSAGNMYSARELLKAHPNNPFTYVGSCLAHQSNLIFKVSEQHAYTEKPCSRCNLVAFHKIFSKHDIDHFENSCNHCLHP